MNKLLVATLCCTALSLTTLRAEHGHHGGGGEHGGGGGDDMNGSENLHVEVPMTPTTAAPAGSAVELSVEGENENGVSDSKLELETRNLPAATYSVAITLKSDGTTVAIGTFTIDAEGEGEIEFGDEGTPFPAGVNPFDIATVTVNDANGVLLFTADLTNLGGASTNINNTVQAVAGSAAPNASGTATLIAVASRNKTNGSLQFAAHSLTPSLPVILAVNGVAAKNLKTDKSGNANVKLGPKGKSGVIVNGVTLTQVTSATLLDKNGNVLLTATF